MADLNSGTVEATPDEVQRAWRRALGFELIVVLMVLYFPTFIDGLLFGHTYNMFDRPTTEHTIRRAVRDSGGIALLLYFAWSKRRSFPIPGLRFDWRWDIPVGVLIFVGLRLFYSVVVWAITGYMILPVIVLRRWDSGTWMLLLMAGTTALAICYEELFMRWYLIGRMEQLSLKTWAAVGASTILFASMHYYLGTMGMISAAFIGLIFALVFVRTRRIAPVILAHFLWDFVIFLQRGHGG